MMVRARAFVGTALAGFIVAACNLLTGVGDLEVGPADASSSVDTGSSDAATDGAISDAQGGADVADAKPIVDTGPPPRCPSAGNSCVKSAPSGWYGPIVIWEGDEDDAPDCPAAMPVNDDFPSGTPFGAFECECRCGGVSGATCKAFLQGYDDGVCTPPASSVDLPLDTCQAPGADVGFRANLVLTVPGSCTSFGGFKSRQNAGFPTMIRGCSRSEPWSADGCGTDELCVPDGVAPFAKGTCIFNDSTDVPCPAPWTVRYRVYGDIDDDRECNRGTCSCATPSGTTCEGSVRNYTAATDCTGVSNAIPLPTSGAPSACIAVAATTSQRVQANTLRAQGGACAASGAPSPAGGVAGVGGGTVCCVP